MRSGCTIQGSVMHIGIGIQRGWTTDRKLHVDTLILIPTLKIYVFWYSRQTDEQTDGRTKTLIQGGFPHYVPPGTLAVRGLEELFFHCLRKVPPAHAPWV
jgi:hypothetical protein